MPSPIQNLTQEEIVDLIKKSQLEQAAKDSTNSLILLSIAIVAAVLLIIWFIKLFKLALKLKAIQGPKDKLTASFLFVFTGIIGGIIFLEIRLRQVKENRNKK